jgi:membrane associated rhomboid family serine protease
MSDDLEATDPAGESAVRSTRRRPLAEEWALVLAAEGLAPSIRHGAAGFAVCVPSAEQSAAASALAAYERENVHAQAGDPPSDQPLRDSHLIVAAAASFAMLAFFATTGPRNAGVDWFAAGSADAARILDGELWRTLTALCLHADLGHVVANALFGGLFLAAVCSGFGPGLALALTLLAGSTGNLANALFQGPEHVSVGASTAVFGAVGLLAGRALALRLRRGGRRLHLWVPIAAGLALIAMLGTGERTDVWAHLFGFVAGCLLGVAASLACPRAPRSPVQWALGGGSAGVVLYGWKLALG